MDLFADDAEEYRRAVTAADAIDAAVQDDVTAAWNDGRIKGRWVDEIIEGESEEPEPVHEEPEDEGAWGEEAPEPEQGLDDDLESGLEEELDLVEPEDAPAAAPAAAPKAAPTAAPAAAPSSARQPTTQPASHADVWDEDEWEDMDINAPASQTARPSGDVGGTAADDDTEEEDAVPVRGAWLDSSGGAPGSSTGSAPWTGAQDPRKSQPGVAEEGVDEEMEGYDPRLHQAGVDEDEDAVIPPTDPRSVRVVSRNGPVNMGAACLFCSGFGEVVAMRLEEGARGKEAVIEFRTDEAAQACLDKREHEDMMILPRVIDDI